MIHLDVKCNPQGFLNRIDWCYQSEDQATLEISFQPELNLNLTNLLNRFKNFLITGEPVGAIPWKYIDHHGWTEFQFQVYQLLTQIPHGETRTYSWVASRLGNTSATRAVGQALRKNPIPILIPCHRVVSLHALGGYMGVTNPQEPELQFKQWLIQLENNYRNPVFSFLDPIPSFASVGI